MKRFFKNALRIRKYLAMVFALLLLFVICKTFLDLRELPVTAQSLTGRPKRQLIVDRHGQRLTSSFENQWNLFDQVSLGDVPEQLVKAFLIAEDRNFYTHNGVDWSGRMAALTQALQQGSFYRGASTITEQVVRILHPRPRTFWSRWLETFEAYQLERSWDKSSILEFYVNQVPYGRQQRGIVQASRTYFGRDLNTLNDEEILSLAVLVRAPSSLDPRQFHGKLFKRVEWLANKLQMKVARENLQIDEASRFQDVLVQAPHFAEFVRKDDAIWSSSHGVDDHAVIETSLDGELQNFSQQLLETAVKSWRSKNVNHGALLVVDNQTGEVLSWAVGGETSYNAVLTPRQPGSALKPFLYGLALAKGWTAATMIIDEPMVTAVGTGVHAIRNYSREYYGPVTLREALGNSLNTPAIKTVKYVTPEKFLDFLKSLPISTLDKSVDVYGEGLALGSAEVSLFELVQAYTLFANRGQVRKLRWFRAEPNQLGQPVLSSEVSSLITNILSDPKARALEFGRNSILNFPSPTAIKTGTATDYRDAWAVGYNPRFTVGIWMGDLERKPTDGNTGARGPGMILRSVFNYLNRKYPDTALPILDPHLVQREVCRKEDSVVLRNNSCEFYYEYFIAGSEESFNVDSALPAAPARISFPVSHMRVAWDPRVDPKAQALEFRVENAIDFKRIEWSVNGELIASTKEAKALWPLQRGRQILSARLVGPNGQVDDLGEVSFVVK